MKNKCFLSSVAHAVEGFLKACRNEKNLRFHLVIANLICVFAYFFGISKIEWAVLMVAIIIVIFAELINTSVEATVDTATDKILPTAKMAKDSAAAAVLFSALGAIVLGVVLFGDIKKITYTLEMIFTDAKKLIPCLVLGIADLFFLFGFKKRK